MQLSNFKYQKNYSKLKKKESRYCLICQKDLYDEISFTNLFVINKIICEKCLSSFKSLLLQKKILNIDCLILYQYNDFFKDLLYRYKGCYDIELAPVFLHQYKYLLKKKYKNYVCIFPPSSKSDNEKRKFKHLFEILKSLNFQIYDIFNKESDYKQSNQNFNDRINIKNHISIHFDGNLLNKQILLCDDIMTSKNTIKSCINLLLRNNIKKENIKILILAMSFKD